MIIKDYEKDGLIYFTKSKRKGSASDISNTYILNTENGLYVIDTSCGNARLREIKDFLKEKKNFTLLCTHYHNDHIANNGRIAHRKTKIIYHELAAVKTTNLRTNATGQILSMYRLLDKKGMLTRMGYFSDRFIRIILKTKFTSEQLMIPILFAASYIFSLLTIGRIYPGKKQISFLATEGKQKLNFNGCEFNGWKIDDALYAIETPGHTDCHIAFYYRDKKILFTGDMLNFLTPNDIQFGEIESTLSTQKKIHNLAAKDNINMICQGHYEPLKGNKEILEYISDTISMHEHVRDIIIDNINQENINLPFDDLYTQIISINDPVIKKLAKITFPRSTLVFLDVYLHKLIINIKNNGNITEKENGKY